MRSCSSPTTTAPARQAWEASSLSPLAARSYPAVREREETARCGRRSSAIATGSCTGSCSAAEAQDAGVRGPEGDHYRTRLTHTLEVTPIARSVARALDLNEDLTEAIGLATTSAIHRSGTSARRRWTRAAGAVRRRLSPLRAFAAGGRARAQPLCGRPRRDPLPFGRRQPRTLEGRIVRLVDRVAYINHDIDDALRAGVLTDALPRERSRAGADGCSRIDPLVHDLVEHSSGRATSCRARRRPGDGRACGRSCSQVYLGPASATRGAKVERAIRTLFDEYGTGRRSCRRAWRGPKRVTDYIAGMTDRYATRFSALPCRRISGLMARYTDDSVERVRDAIDMDELVGGRTELRRAGTHRYEGLCPFHDERTPSFGIDPVEKLYHCFGCGEGGDAIKFVRETEGVDFMGALELLADRYGVSSSSRTRTRARRSGAARDRLLALLDRTAAFYERVLWETGRRPRASVPARAGLTEEALRTIASATRRRVGTRAVASAPAGYTERAVDVGLASTARRARLRPLPRADHVPAVRRPRARGRLRRARAGRTTAQVPEHVRQRGLPQGAEVYGADLARAGGEGRARGPRRGLHRRDRAAPGGLRRGGRVDGDGADGGAGRALRRLAPTCACRTRTSRARRRCARRERRAGLVRAQARRGSTCGSCGCPRGWTRRTWSAVGGTGARAARRAMPFARFEVERALERGETAADGRDHALEEAAGAIRALPPSVLREELIQLVAGRLGLSESLVASRRGAGAAAAPVPPAARGRARGARPPRADGARLPRLCLARPRRGRGGWPVISTAVLRRGHASCRRVPARAARSTAGALPAGDEPLARARRRARDPRGGARGDAGRARARGAPARAGRPGAPDHPRSRLRRAGRHRLPRGRAPACPRRHPRAHALALLPSTSLGHPLPSGKRTSVPQSWRRHGWRRGWGREASIEAIARAAGRHPSTVAYWARKHGLGSHARPDATPPAAGIERDALAGSRRDRASTKRATSQRRST